MKKNQLILGNVVSFVKNGKVDNGIIKSKNIYNVKIEVTDESGVVEVVDVPYKDVKSVM